MGEYLSSLGTLGGNRQEREWPVDPEGDIISEMEEVEVKGDIKIMPYVKLISFASLTFALFLLVTQRI